MAYSIGVSVMLWFHTRTSPCHTLENPTISTTKPKSITYVIPTVTPSILWRSLQRSIPLRDVTFPWTDILLPLQSLGGPTDHKFTIVGTMKHSRKGILKEFKTVDGREKLSNKFIHVQDSGDENIMLVSYVDKKT